MPILPDTLPQATTHLWFWTADCQGRVRIDAAFWVAGVLAPEGMTLPAAWSRMDSFIDATLHRPCKEDWSPVKQRRGDPAAGKPLAQLVPQRAQTGVSLTGAEQVGLPRQGCDDWSHPCLPGRRSSGQLVEVLWVTHRELSL